MEGVADGSASKFSTGERVYVPHTDRYYEAKILKSEYRGATGWFYFLHYNGWNKKYDEWVEEGGLVKAEEAEALGAAVPAQTKKKSSGAPVLGFPIGSVKGAGGLGSLPLGPALGGGRKGGAAVQGLGPALGGPLPPPGAPPVGLDLDIPVLLKKILVEDFEKVFEQRRLVPLPRVPCVQDVLARYVAEAKETRGAVDAEEEVAAGLTAYFDKCLLPLLLYRNERTQAAEALADGRAPSSVYGAEHLARLLSRLPDVMPLAQLTDDQLAHVAAMVQDVMQWLAESHSTIFLPKEQYLPAPPEPVAGGAPA